MAVLRTGLAIYMCTTGRGWRVLKTLNVVVFGKNAFDHRFDIVFYRRGDDSWQPLIEVLNVVSYIVGVTDYVRVANLHLTIHVQVWRRNLVCDSVLVQAEVIHDVILDHGFGW